VIWGFLKGQKKGIMKRRIKIIQVLSQLLEGVNYAQNGLLSRGEWQRLVKKTSNELDALKLNSQEKSFVRETLEYIEGYVSQR